MRACGGGFRIPSWYLLLVAVLGILSGCQSLRDLERFARRYGQTDGICAIRQQTYEEARQKHPQRWSRHIRDWSQPQVMSINHPRLQQPVGA